MEQEQKPKLESYTMAMMLATAGFFDALQFVLTPILLGWIVTIPAFLTFYIWFKLHGISFATTKRAGIMGGGFIFELIPALNALPAWTLAVALIIADTKIKERA